MKKTLLYIALIFLSIAVYAQDTINHESLYMNRIDSLKYSKTDSAIFSGYAKRVKNGRIYAIEYYKNGIIQDTTKYYDWIGRLCYTVYYKDNKPLNSQYYSIDKTNGEVYFPIAVDSFPFFPGGDSELLRFIGKNLIYNKICSEMHNSQSIKIFVGIVIGKKGEIIEKRIFSDFSIHYCKEMHDECFRVIDLMPKWKPAIKNGKTVNCYYMIPFKVSVN